MPKHASWLNMVEIEIGVLASQCLARRMPDLATLTAEVAAWVDTRTAESATIKWMFGIEQARLNWDTPTRRPMSLEMWPLEPVRSPATRY